MLQSRLCGVRCAIQGRVDGCHRLGMRVRRRGGKIFSASVSSSPAPCHHPQNEEILDTMNQHWRPAGPPLDPMTFAYFVTPFAARVEYTFTSMPFAFTHVFRNFPG